jgi:tetratricopeptide (TPR) repeat protein
MLLPGVALAGSAALLLYLVQPSEQLSLDSPSVDETPAAREEARLAPEPGLAPAAPSPVELAAPEKTLLDPAAPAAPAMEADKRAGGAGGAASEAPDAAVSKDMDAKVDRPKSKLPRKDDVPADEEVLPGLGDAPPAAADKEELRDTLEQADQARHRGDCKSAEDRYLEAMKMDGALIEQARARAGYAICLQQQGDEAVASKYFEKARLMYPGIDSWIAREGGEKKPSKKAPAPSPKPKKQIAEPFK